MLPLATVVLIAAHLFLVSPSKEMVTDWGHETAEQEYFITEPRQRQLARIQASPFIPHRDSIRGFVYEVETGRLRPVEG